jgi:hypothetical protein
MQLYRHESLHRLFSLSTLAFPHVVYQKATDNSAKILLKYSLNVLKQLLTL